MCQELPLALAVLTHLTLITTLQGKFYYQKKVFRLDNWPHDSILKTSFAS